MSTNSNAAMTKDERAHVRSLESQAQTDDTAQRVHAVAQLSTVPDDELSEQTQRLIMDAAVDVKTHADASTDDADRLAEEYKTALVTQRQATLDMAIYAERVTSRGWITRKALAKLWKGAGTSGMTQSRIGTLIAASKYAAELHAGDPDAFDGVVRAIHTYSQAEVQAAIESAPSVKSAEPGEVGSKLHAAIERKRAKSNGNGDGDDSTPSESSTDSTDDSTPSDQGEQSDQDDSDSNGHDAVNAAYQLARALDLMSKTGEALPDGAVTREPSLTGLQVAEMAHAALVDYIDAHSVMEGETVDVD